MEHYEAPDSLSESSQRSLSQHGNDRLPLLSYPGGVRGGEREQERGSVRIVSNFVITGFFIMYPVDQGDIL